MVTANKFVYKTSTPHLVHLHCDKSNEFGINCCEFQHIRFSTQSKNEKLFFLFFNKIMLNKFLGKMCAEIISFQTEWLPQVRLDSIAAFLYRQAVFVINLLHTNASDKTKATFPITIPVTL